MTMPNDNQTTSESPSCDAACSPSSLTPESNEAWDAVSRTPDGMYDSRVPIKEYAYAMAEHSRKMERERNLNRGHLEHIRDAVRNLRDVKGRHHAQQAMERLLALLPENVKVLSHLPGGEASTVG
jgi:hypothetical protein